MTSPVNSHHIRGGKGLGCHRLGDPLHPPVYTYCKLAFPKNFLSVIRILIVFQLSSERSFLLSTEESSSSMDCPCCQNDRWKVTKLPEGSLLAVSANVLDALKSSRNAFEINNESWESLAAERGTWRSLIWRGAESYEQTRIRQAEEKRLFRKSSAAETSSAIITVLPCPSCDRTVRARIDLIHIPYMRQTSGHHPRRMEEKEKIGIWIGFSIK